MIDQFRQAIRSESKAFIELAMSVRIELLKSNDNQRIFQNGNM